MAQIGRRIDQQPQAVIALDHDGHTRAPIAGFLGIAIAPVVANARHPGRSARAQDDQFHDRARLNRRKKLALVTSASASLVVPRSLAT